MNEVDWQWLNFTEMDAQLLYQVLQLREAVFHLEQQCVYSDLDGFDQDSFHCLGMQNGHLLAYCRVREVEQGVALERVLTDKESRGSGLGRALIHEALRFIAQNFPDKDVIISAQLRLDALYQSFGFESCGSPYDDAGIKHIKMVLKTVDV